MRILVLESMRYLYASVNLICLPDFITLPYLKKVVSSCGENAPKFVTKDSYDAGNISSSSTTLEVMVILLLSRSSVFIEIEVVSDL